MKRAMFFLATLSLYPTFTWPCFSQAPPSIREVPVTAQIPDQEYRIYIVDLLESGEDLDGFRVVDQPSFGDLILDGHTLIFRPMADFEIAEGDVFSYEVTHLSGSVDLRLAFLSPVPATSSLVFRHNFDDGSYEVWTDFPGSSDVFSFVEGIVGKQSLEAKLGPGTEELGRDQDGAIVPGGTNGNWGGGTTVIVCPDEDPNDGEPGTLDGSVVVYQAGARAGGSRLRLRVQREAGNWQARVEIDGHICIPSQPCITPWLDMQEGAPERVDIYSSGPEWDSHLFFTIGNQTESIPFGGRWINLDEHRLGVLELVGLTGNRLIFDEFQTNGYFNVFQQRVADDFEDMHFSPTWDDISSSTGLQIAAEAALSGRGGLLVDPLAASSSPAKVLRESTAEPAEDYGARFEIDTTTLELQRGESLKILGASATDSHDREHLRLSLVGTGRDVVLVGELIDDLGMKHSTGGISLPSGRKHTVVVRWTSDDPEGGFWLWRNGNLASALTLPNPAARVKSVRVGAFEVSTESGQNEDLGFLKLDGFVAW